KKGVGNSEFESSRPLFGTGQARSGELSMRMSDFVIRDAIVPELTATTKETVIKEMVDALRNAGNFKSGETEDIVRAIQKRELLGSTGIGRGVAIPHTKHSSV